MKEWSYNEIHPINNSPFLKPAFLLFIQTPESTGKLQIELHLNCELFPCIKRGIHSIYEEEEEKVYSSTIYVIIILKKEMNLKTFCSHRVPIDTIKRRAFEILYVK